MTIPMQTLRPTQRDGACRQMSHANPFDGRGRGRDAARSAHAGHSTDRAAFLRRWSLLMIASFASREVCAVHFGVTFQTACNWFDGLNAPYGHHVDHATRTLARYAEIMQGE